MNKIGQLMVGRQSQYPRGKVSLATVIRIYSVIEVVASAQSGGGQHGTESIDLVLWWNSVLPAVRLWLMGSSLGGCIRGWCFALSFFFVKI